MSLLKQARVPLAFLPTPVHALTRLTEQLKGPKLLIKRDDQTGLAFGGNKTRKLEFLVGDALEQGADTLITAGAIQSNHCRQTAAAAAQLGLRCELLIKGNEPESLEGNTLLDHLLGAHLHWQEEGIDLEGLAQQVRAAGFKPYVIGYGGSNSIGALGYVNAMKEFLEQQKGAREPVTHMVFASCSGGTHAGLVVGGKMEGFSGEILGISIENGISKKIEVEQELVALGNATVRQLGVDLSFAQEDFLICYEYAAGYAVLGDLERSAIYQLAQQEGILLDPVYTGRAFGALLDLISKGYFAADDSVLFWHTGGGPAIFPYGRGLLEKN